MYNNEHKQTVNNRIKSIGKEFCNQHSICLNFIERKPRVIKQRIDTKVSA